MLFWTACLSYVDTAKVDPRLSHSSQFALSPSVSGFLRASKVHGLIFVVAPGVPVYNTGSDSLVYRG